MKPLSINFPSLQAVIDVLTRAGFDRTEQEWVSNGEQIKLKNGAVIVRYDTGTVVVQGKNSHEVEPLLRREAAAAAKAASGGAAIKPVEVKQPPKPRIPKTRGRPKGSKNKHKAAGQKKAGIGRAATQ
jgi:hypothetical protein